MNKQKNVILYIFLAVLLCVNIALHNTFNAPYQHDDPADDMVSPSLETTDLKDIMAGLPVSYLSQIEQHEADRKQKEQSDGTEETRYTESEIEAIKQFYSETVFVGDSMLLGYRSYVMAYDDYGCISSSLMLASSGYSTINANKLISDESIHPYYKGFQRYVWDSIEMYGAKRVVLCFWANEFSRGDLASSERNLIKLVDKIVEHNPGIEIYIISPCHRYNSTFVGEASLTNENLTLLAQSRRNFCEETGAGYIEISRYLGNETDGMYEEYTRDKYVHVNNDAYVIWSQVLMDYALGREAVINNGH